MWDGGQIFWPIIGPNFFGEESACPEGKSEQDKHDEGLID